jgi:hypothetical protein
LEFAFWRRSWEKRSPTAGRRMLSPYNFDLARSFFGSRRSRTHAVTVTFDTDSIRTWTSSGLVASLNLFLATSSAVEGHINLLDGRLGLERTIAWRIRGKVDVGFIVYERVKPATGTGKG